MQDAYLVYIYSPREPMARKASHPTPPARPKRLVRKLEIGSLLSAWRDRLALLAVRPASAEAGSARSVAGEAGATPEGSLSSGLLRTLGSPAS